MDGGSVRALIQGVVLTEIEHRTKKPISSLFDLIAGTSSGGNLAMGLTTPDAHGRPKYPASDVARSYKENTPKIFHRSFLQTINPFSSLFEEKYSTPVAAGVYKKYYGARKLSEAIIPVVITGYEIEKRMAYFFKSTLAKEDPTNDFLMRDVVLATTAAPTFFEPAKIENIASTDTYYFIDGGVFANNPSLIALTEARLSFPHETDFLLVSLGSGVLNKPILYEEVKGWGVAQWARPILDVVFDGIADTVDHELKHSLHRADGMANRYYRFQTQLTEEMKAFDDTSEQNFAALEELGQQLVDDNDETLDILCKQLTTK